MAIPGQLESAGGGGGDWTTLDVAAKQRRLLDSAARIFARDGLDVPVPAIAAAAGVGVGTFYRLFSSKQELITVLLLERLGGVMQLASAALHAEDPWVGLEDLLWAIAERQVNDFLAGEALAAASRQPEMSTALAEARASIERVLERAHEGGVLREGVTYADIRLVFVAVRASAALETTDSWRRMLTLLLDALRQ